MNTQDAVALRREMKQLMALQSPDV
jgi:hypothetical protein